jgi:catechol 2,3-dioxygenase-like lactoylglutathione lyase family enzyme
MMFHHVSIGVSDLERARKFYDAALEPLGYTRLSTSDKWLGYGTEQPQLWIKLAERPVVPDMESGLHFCFVAPNEEGVRTFHANAMASGGTDNGEPGIRPEYGSFYYAAFVIDPDGYRLEAFFRRPE